MHHKKIETFGYYIILLYYIVNIRNGYFLTVLSRALFRTQSKAYSGVFCKNSLHLLAVKKKETNYVIWFFIILCNFINSPAFIDIKLCIIK